MKPELATLIGTVAVAVIGLISGILVKRARSPQTVEQVANTVVTTAAALIDEVRQQQVAQKADYEHKLAEQRTKYDAEISALNGRITTMEDRHARVLAALIAHAPWDTTAWARLRGDDPNWPPPPPLDAH